MNSNHHHHHHLLQHHYRRSSSKHHHQLKLTIHHVPRAAKHIMRFNCCCISIATKCGGGAASGRRKRLGRTSIGVNQKLTKRNDEKNALLQFPISSPQTNCSNQNHEMDDNGNNKNTKSTAKLITKIETPRKQQTTSLLGDDDTFYGISALDRKCRSSQYIHHMNRINPKATFEADKYSTSLMSDRAMISFRSEGLDEYSKMNEIPSGNEDTSTENFNLEIKVTLRKKMPSEMIGLTLCYAFMKGVVRIYVQEVEPRTVADRSGQIFPGDQIKTVNGVVLNSRIQAISLFRNDMKFKICIIRTPYAAISRCLFSKKMFSLSSEVVESNEVYGSCTSQQQKTDPSLKSQFGPIGRLPICYEDTCTSEPKLNLVHWSYLRDGWANINGNNNHCNLLGNMSSSTINLFTAAHQFRPKHSTDSSFSSEDRISNDHAILQSVQPETSKLISTKRNTSMSVLRLQTLKARERKIIEERSFTTEDECTSDAKLGKYWTRNQRKSHLAKAKKNRGKKNIVFSRT